MYILMQKTGRTFWINQTLEKLTITIHRKKNQFIHIQIVAMISKTMRILVFWPILLTTCPTWMKRSKGTLINMVTAPIMKWCWLPGKVDITREGQSSYWNKCCCFITYSYLQLCVDMVIFKNEIHSTILLFKRVEVNTWMGVHILD